MLTVAYEWFSANWQYAGFVAGLILLALVPLLVGVWGLPLLLVYLLLPIYMVHQLEEHAGDRFHRFVSVHIGHGRDVLTSNAIVVINIGLVWIACLVALYLARFVDLGLGLIAVYLVLVNALVHIIGAAKQRAYNPGLVTSLILFLPFGIWAMTLIAPHATLAEHLLGLVLAVGGHAAIIVVILGRVRSPDTPLFTK